MVIGTKTKAVNAGKFIWKLGTDEFILLTKKSVDYRTPQKRLPISGGNIYYTMKSDNKFSVSIAYATDEVGVTIPNSFDNMITALAASGEIPEKAFTFVTTPRDGSANKTYTINAKMTGFRSYAEAEGETLIDLDFQIIDDSPSIA